MCATGTWRGPWGLCLAPQRLPGLPWGGAHTCHPWAVAACHQRGPQACSNVTTSWEPPRPGSLLWLPLPFSVWRPLPLSDLGSLVKCNFLVETFQTPKAGRPHSGHCLYSGSHSTLAFSAPTLLSFTVSVFPHSPCALRKPWGIALPSTVPGMRQMFSQYPLEYAKEPLG